MRPDASRPQSDIRQRIQAVLSGLDCECRERLDRALETFVSLEEKRNRRQALGDARHQRDIIVALTALLEEIDEIGLGEPDESVFEEIALLFEDIALAARAGAEAVRKVSRPSSDPRQRDTPLRLA